MGYYEEEGLDVEVVALPGRPAETTGLVVAGQADLTIAQPDAHIYPIAEGNDQGLIWTFTPYQGPVFGIVVDESSEITEASQLENKTVAMTALGPPFESFMNANVIETGGDPSTIDTVAIGSNPAAMEALRSGGIEAIVGNRSEMALASQVTGTQTRLLPLPPEVADGLAAGFIIRKDSDQTEREAIARYIRAVVKSAIFAQENPDKAVQLSWELYPASKPTDKPEEQALEEAKVSLAETVDQYRPSSDGVWGYISEERWQKFLESNGFSDKIPDVTTLYDYSLLDLINSFDEEEVREQARNK
ncbi:ABC transporter substrate-binding protein [Halalkalibacter alkalisediminis]|uniref:ABC transporter substrate-binding protein n=1 Tax=Halalkalibacter alkalisediminis TaxID=935616 RepID=A0ABV6NIJ7_9BACI|nr:ABC transporter substrate-binding protein [Halalkalibacter alkalisediminis]